MEFLLEVSDITNDLPNVIKLSGEVNATIEIPLERLGVSLQKGDKVKLVIQREKDQDMKKYKIYAWGIVYYIGDGITRISIGGLQLDIMKELPLQIGDKVYIGII
ncbi:hypothetical protein [Pyrobaculum neutrophilum]|uniref:Uncharacterized protein n=1 Tax=Pyrobaculum neutrophilum (strain DSM 2338 / JCM 9278 / NBRC 100436 / V24Sta) TaxID=444157 RepID=B1Y928_PYRNV|nr:hypothetical protein [Pyrobaculum neutrophilum]ACB40257.1 conserved hypothetical protein [Pyrobaculum neutrophilum V24Sta]